MRAQRPISEHHSGFSQVKFPSPQPFSVYNPQQGVPTFLFAQPQHTTQFQAQPAMRGPNSARFTPIYSGSDKRQSETVSEPGDGEEDMRAI